MSEQPPVRIGEYEIVSALDRGGMGSIFKVRNLISDRIEAMKILLPDLAGRQELAERFRREIKILASLDHPNIAALRTALSWENRLVMIMEYVEGITLEGRIAHGALPAHEALAYTRQVLAALAYAHGRHIIHRDIKPGNIMLTQSGSVKLMDFGIARCSEDRTLTATGTTLGSLYYMSPEQVKGEPADERSDLYSLGITLYEMVTAKRPFEADNNYSIMVAHVREEPKPPIALRSDLPGSLNDIILRVLAKNPGERFQSAEEFSEALNRVVPAVDQVQSSSAATSTAVAFPGGGVTFDTVSLNAELQNSAPHPETRPPTVHSNLSSPPGSLPSVGPLNSSLIQDSAPSARAGSPPSIRQQEQNQLTSASRETRAINPLRPGVDRGLYMGLGAGVVLLVLIVAAIVFPHANRTQAGTTVHQSPPVIVKPPELENLRASPNAPAAPQADISPPSSPPLTMQPLPVKPKGQNSGYKNNGNVARGGRSNNAITAPGVAEEGKKEINSAWPAMPQSPQQAAPASAEGQSVLETKHGAADAARLAQLSHDLDLLSSRADSIAQSLKTLADVQRSQGLGLRGDIVSSEARMQKFISRAESALNAQDAEQATKYLNLAETEANALENFLGR